MGWLEDFIKFAAPIAGGAIGFGLGGPIGAAIGTAGGGGLSGIIHSGENRAREDAQIAANIALQREFAQHGLRWRMEDAQRAGIHPLAALGFQGPSFSPVSTFTDSENYLGNMGQDISRAIQTTRTGEEQQIAKLQIANAQADLDGKVIDNQIRATQLHKLNSAGPGLPNGDNFIPGQGNSNLVQDKPLSRVISAPGRPAQEAGWRPDVSFSRTDTGLAPVVPESLSESLEDDVLGKAQWRLRNQLLPNVTGEGKPPLRMLPRGYNDWFFNRFKQEWQPIRTGMRQFEYLTKGR